MTGTIISNSVRFVKLRLKNYGIFGGDNLIEFNSHRTLIVGQSGLGKTTIWKALRQLGPVPGVDANICNNALQMSLEIDVLTAGNRSLIERYRGIIFLSAETEYPSSFHELPFAVDLDRTSLDLVRNETNKIFRTFVSNEKRHNDFLEDLDSKSMLPGERLCLVLAYAFAYRRIMNLDVPVVLDSPFVVLTYEQRNSIRSFLKKQLFQQIIIGSYS